MSIRKEVDEHARFGTASLDGRDRKVRDAVVQVQR